MNKIQLSLVFAMLFLITSCSKKSHPSKNASVIYKKENTVQKSNDEKTADNTTTTSAPVRKPLSPQKEKKLFPETIYVNDAAAKKSVDGRLYYDVEGHRYWKNYKDGKYYLFNKSMYTNPDFKPSVKKNG